MACLDTSLLLDLSGRGGRGLQQRARRKLEELHAAGEALATTRFTVAELWVGIERSAAPGKEQIAVQQLLRPLVILDFDETGARAFGRLVSYLQVRGLTTGDMDALIASIALVSGHSIVTQNTRPFENIPGLKVEGY